MSKNSDFMNNLYCSYINMKNALRGFPFRIESGEAHDMYVVKDPQTRIHVCRKRSRRRFRKGLANGIERLAREYHIGALENLDGGLLIDCGANIGELGIWARGRGMDYIAFEPEQMEARCCDLNNFDGEATTNRKALWSENKTLKFYHKPNTADSSLIPGSENLDFTEIQAVALDAFLDIGDRARPVIFKVEAEGAEPEVLEGAKKSLARIDYVAVDCGPERGPNKDHTFVETNTLLLDSGFELIAAKFGRITALYRNRNRPTA